MRASCSESSSCKAREFWRIVGVAVMLDDDGGAAETLKDVTCTFCVGSDSVISGVVGRRSFTSTLGVDGVSSTGIRIASTGEHCSESLWTRDGIGTGGGMEGRMGFGRWRGGASCY